MSEIGGKGLFSKQIEDELLDDKIQIAIHALKDMPSQETNGLITNSFLKRNVDIHDVGNSALYLLSNLAMGLLAKSTM